MPGLIEFDADARRGDLKCAKVTLGTVGTVTVITLPRDYKGVELSKTAPVGRFNVGAAPAAEAVLTGAALDAASFAAGNYIWDSATYVRMLEQGCGTLQLWAMGGGEVFYISIW